MTETRDSNSVHVDKWLTATNVIVAVTLACAPTGAQADISVSPQNPQPGSMVAVSACVQLQRVDDPAGVFVQLDGKPAVNNSTVYGWCAPNESFFGIPGTVGFGAQAFTFDHWQVPGNSPPTTTVPTVLINNVGPGEHTITVTVEYKDGAKQRATYALHVTPMAGRVLYPEVQAASGGSAGSIRWGSPGPSMASAEPPKARMGAAPSTVAQAATGRFIASVVVLSPTHGPNGSQVHVSACGFPGPQGSQYDVAVDNVKAFMNLPVAACGSGKFGFGTGTSLPPVTVTVRGSGGSRHTIDVTNLGSTSYIVDP